MERQARKSATAAWRERRSEAGIYALRCVATGEVWVGATPDLGSIRNRLWFTLNQGASPHRALQAAWRAQGEAAFAFEVLERLPEDASPGLRQHDLRRGRAAWIDRLGARSI